MAAFTPPSRRDLTRSLDRSHGSFELVLAPVLLALLGLWLDRTIDTVPVFTLVFALVGILGTFAKLYYAYRGAMDAAASDAVWAEHPTTVQFRAQAAARAERLSTPKESAAGADRGTASADLADGRATGERP